MMEACDLTMVRFATVYNLNSFCFEIKTVLSFVVMHWVHLALCCAFLICFEVIVLHAFP